MKVVQGFCELLIARLREKKVFLLNLICYVLGEGDSIQVFREVNVSEQEMENKNMNTAQQLLSRPYFVFKHLHFRLEYK